MSAPRDGNQTQNADSSNVQRATSSQVPQAVVVTAPTPPANTTPTVQWLEYRAVDTANATPHARAVYPHPPGAIPFQVPGGGTVWAYPLPQSSQDQHQSPSSAHLGVPQPGPGNGQWNEYRSPYASQPPAVPGTSDSRSTSRIPVPGGFLTIMEVPPQPNPPGITGWDRLAAAQDEARRAVTATFAGAAPSPSPRSDRGDTSSHSRDSRQPGGSAPENRVGFMNPGYQPTRRPRGNDRSDGSRERSPPPPYSP